MTMQTSLVPAARERWWQGVTRTQWLVLTIASAGWVFDVFEGRFGLIRGQAKWFGEVNIARAQIDAAPLDADVDDVVFIHPGLDLFREDSQS